MNQNLPQNQQKQIIYQNQMNQNLLQNQKKQVINRPIQPIQQIQQKQIVNGSLPYNQNQNVVKNQNINGNINQNINQQINTNQNQIINQNIKNKQQNINQNHKKSKTQEQDELEGLNIDALFNKHNNEVDQQVSNIMHQFQSPKDIEEFISHQPKANTTNLEELLKQPKNNEAEVVNNNNFDYLFKEGGNKQIDDKLFDKLFSLPQQNSQNKNNQNLNNQNNQSPLYHTQQIQSGKQQNSNQNNNLTHNNSPNRNIQ